MYLHNNGNHGRRALSLVTQDGVQFMIEAVRAKIEQRTSGGPFALRKGTSRESDVTL